MRTYDLVMTHKLDADDWFIHCIRRSCADQRLNFFLVEPIWVESFFREFERRQPFVIKPATGYGRRGVIMDATSESDLTRAAQAWSDHHYLLQQCIQPRLIDGCPAHYRVYYVFGSTFTCCWNCYNDHYRSVETIDIGNTPLWPLDALAHRIAELTGMSFFSTEVALTESGEFVAIDYANDQCHMLSQSADPQIGVPDQLVATIAQHLVQGACQLLGRNRRFSQEGVARFL